MHLKRSKYITHYLERNVYGTTDFSNSEFGEIRTITKDDEPMFCLADVCKALEITHVTDVKNRLKQDGSVLPRS